jgi:outer membrane protein assembly factor BamB
VREGPAFQERPWPVYLGSPARAAASAESLAADPQMVWRVSVGRGSTGGVALGEDVLGVASSDHRAILYDRATGTFLWDRRLNQAIGAGPLLRDDRMFVAEQGPGGKVYALRLLNGRVIWSVDAGDVAAPLALDGGALYAATVEGRILRIASDSGKQRWSARLPGGVRAAPVPTAAGLVVATGADSIYLLDPATGAVRVRRGTRGTVLAAPARADSLVVIGTSSGMLAALETATLRPLWVLDLGEPIVGSVAIQDGRAWALTGRGLLAIVPLGDPAAARRLPLGVITRAGPMPVRGGVLVSTVDGDLVLFDSTGTRRWAARLDAPVLEPALVDAHTVIALSRRGILAAYR